MTFSVATNLSRGAPSLMPVLAVRTAQKTFPTGDPKFAVMQSFPGAFTAEEADPFLMCDHFNGVSKGRMSDDPDVFPINWHPHRGMDIVTYLTTGVGRHGDSMGNRETFHGPGMQWCSVGSGIEHAEDMATPAGQPYNGFQIWINVPAADKMKDPRYGTEGPDKIPSLSSADEPALMVGDVVGRVLAGEHLGRNGPFKTVVPVHMIDYELRSAGASVSHEVPAGLDTVLVLCYYGFGYVNGVKAQQNVVMKLNADDPTAPRRIELRADASTSGQLPVVAFLIFAGKRINERIAWRGPIVMGTDSELQTAFHELREGTFLKKRVPWNYKKLSAFPRAKNPEL